MPDKAQNDKAINEQLWQAVQVQLALQLQAQHMADAVKKTRYVVFRDGVMVLVTGSQFVQLQMERIKRLVKNMATDIAGQPIEIRVEMQR